MVYNTVTTNLPAKPIHIAKSPENILYVLAQIAITPCCPGDDA